MRLNKGGLLDNTELLKLALERTDGWLKFGEGKNVLLLTTNSGLFFGLMQAKVQSDWQIASLSLILVSSIVCSISFIPKLDVSLSLSKNHKCNNDNLLYFGDISKYSPAEILEALKLEPNQSNFFIAGQTVINSKIALKKFRHFTTGIGLTLLALIAAGLSFLF